MIISKNSLNSFANQYNVAVCTKAVYFRVIDTQITRDILALLYKEGFISGYNFNFEDVYLPESKGLLKKNNIVFPLSRTRQVRINPRPYFFNFQSVALLQRSGIDQESVRHPDFSSDYYSNTMLSNNKTHREGWRFCYFVIKFLLLYYNLFMQTSGVDTTAWAIFNSYHFFRAKQSSNILVAAGNKEILFRSVCDAIIDLKSISDRSDYMHAPVHLAFSREWEFDLLGFLEHQAQYGKPVRAPTPVTRLELQLNLSQDKWKFTDITFDKEYIFVFPKYTSGRSVLKKMSVGSDTVLWKNVSYKQMRLYKAEAGFSRFFILTTSNGLMLDTSGDLFFKQGGIIILKLFL